MDTATSLSEHLAVKYVYVSLKLMTKTAKPSIPSQNDGPTGRGGSRLRAGQKARELRGVVRVAG